MGDTEDLFDFWNMSETTFSVHKDLAERSLVIRNGKVRCLQQPQQGSLIGFDMDEEKARFIVKNASHVEVSPVGGQIIGHSLRVKKMGAIYFMESNIDIMISTSEN